MTNLCTAPTKAAPLLVEEPTDEESHTDFDLTCCPRLPLPCELIDLEDL